MYSQGLALAQALAAQQLLKTLPKVVVTKCFKDRSEVVGVRCPNGTYYLYIYDGSIKKFVAHKCSCQPRVTEMDLRPLYVAISEKLQRSVIFMHNTLSRRIEQYTYDFDSDTFVEVKRTGLVYNQALVGQSNLVCMMYGPNAEQLMIEADQYGYLRKQICRDTFNFKVTTRSEVKTLIMQSIEKNDNEELSDGDYEDGDNCEDDEDSEYDSDSDSEEPSEEDLAYDEYIGSIAPFVLLNCVHHPGSVISAFNYTTDTYDNFFFSDVTGRFVPLDCNCEFRVTEYNLVPKYVQKSHDGKHVIHVHNLFTNIMEKYCYVHGEGLVQVDYPELVYFAGKTTTSAVILSISDPTPVVIMRGINGRLFTETYSHKTCNFVSSITKPVKTYLMQWKEAEKKKREQERLKSKAARAEKYATERNIRGDELVAELCEKLTIERKKYEELNRKLEDKERASKLVGEFQEEREMVGSYITRGYASMELAKKAVKEINSQMKLPVITLDDTPKKSEQVTSRNATARIRVQPMAEKVLGPAKIPVITLDDTPKKSEQVSSGNATVSTTPATEKSSASTAREPLKDITEEALSDFSFNDNRMKELSSKKEKRDQQKHVTYQPLEFCSYPLSQPFSLMGSNVMPMSIMMPYSSQQVQLQNPTMQQGSSTGSSSSQQVQYIPVQLQGNVGYDKKQQQPVMMNQMWQQHGSPTGSSSSLEVQHPQEQDQLVDETMELLEQVIDKVGEESLDSLDRMLNKFFDNAKVSDEAQPKQQEASVPAGTTQNEGKSDGNKAKSVGSNQKVGGQQIIKRGNIGFIQDPTDSQEWIPTKIDESKADKKAEQSGEKELQTQPSAAKPSGVAPMPFVHPPPLGCFPPHNYPFIYTVPRGY